MTCSPKWWTRQCATIGPPRRNASNRAMESADTTGDFANRRSRARRPPRPTRLPQSPPAPVETGHGSATPARRRASRAASVAATEQMLFGDGDLTDFHSRWTEVQAAFVDDPRDCVQKADGLVSDVVDRLTAGFTQARSGLEEQWSRGEQVSTEDLRLALQRYRDFFERLLAV